ncbi:MAG: CsbD family protein [Rhodothermales bacterium]
MKTPTEQQVSGNWKQFKGKVQEAWGVLTDDEMDEFEGQRDQLEGQLEEKTGETREAIRQRIDKFARDVKYSF